MIQSFRPSTIDVPLELFIDLFNAIPAANTDLRSRVLTYIRTYKDTINPKGHVVEGLILQDNGTMAIDDVLYTEAVYRGKINTYAGALLDALKVVRSKVELFGAMARSQQEAQAEIPEERAGRRLGIGRPISDEEAYLVERVRAIQKAIERPAPRRQLQDPARSPKPRKARGRAKRPPT